jgi:hypothetical protein
MTYELRFAKRRQSPEVEVKTAKQVGLTIPPNVLARADKEKILD